MVEEVLTTTGREPSVATDPIRGLGAVPVSTSPLLVDGTSLSGVQAGPDSGSQGAPATQNDYPRSVKYIHTGAVSTFPYTVTITGMTPDGETDTEELTITVAGTYQGVKAWAWITDVDLGGAGVAAGDGWEVQSASKIGIPFSIYAAGDVLYIAKNTALMQVGSFTINTTYNTIEETGVAVAPTDEYWYWVRHHGAI